MSIFLCIVCSCERRETKKESDRQKERQRFPEDRSQGRWSLPVYYMGLSCLHSPHMCREFDMAQYWFHTASDVSISWSRMNSVYILQDRQLLYTKGFKCLLFNVWSRREACSKSIDSFMESRGCFIVFPNERYPANCISLQSWSSWHLSMLINTETMCNERKRVVVVWYFYVVQCFCLLKKILWSNIQEVLQFYYCDSFGIVFCCLSCVFCFQSACVCMRVEGFQVNSARWQRNRWVEEEIWSISLLIRLWLFRW